MSSTDNDGPRNTTFRDRMRHNILNDVANPAQSQVTSMHTRSARFVPNNVPYGNRNQSSAGFMPSSRSLGFDLQELQGKVMYAQLSYIRDGGESMVEFFDTNVMSKRS